MEKIETRLDLLSKKIETNNARKLTTKMFEFENLSDAISLYIDITKELGIRFTVDNGDAPSIFHYNDYVDEFEEFFIEHIDFTDSGELGDVTLNAINGSGIRFTMPGDEFLGLKEPDLDEISSCIYWKLKKFCGIE